MANNVSPSAVPQVEGVEPELRLDDVTLEREKSRESAGQEESAALDGTSFSFKVDRQTTRELKISPRRQLTPTVDPELAREKSNLNRPKSGKAQTKNGMRAGQGTILDRYITFVANMLKLIERFLLRRLTGGILPRGNRTKPSTPSQGLEATPQKKRRRLIPRLWGPKIS